MAVEPKFVQLTNEKEIDGIILHSMSNQINEMFCVTEGGVAVVFKEIYAGRFIYKKEEREEASYEDLPFGKFSENSKDSGCWFEYDKETCQYIPCSNTRLFDLFNGEFRNYYVKIYQQFRNEPSIGRFSKRICFKLTVPLFHDRLLDILKIYFKSKC